MIPERLTILVDPLGLFAGTAQYVDVGLEGDGLDEAEQGEQVRLATEAARSLPDRDIISGKVGVGECPPG
jgi:hypothetical protein